MINKNNRLGLNLLMIVAGMAMLAYASVPLYKLFCATTGFGGTPQIGKSIPREVTDRYITVRFNADTDPSLGWVFEPEQESVKVRVGENSLAFFKAVNKSSEAVTGRAVYNVTPLKTGGYFNKIQCFCFNKQVIQPGKSIDFPVSFFIDPQFAKDPQMKDVDTITLSYTFYRVPDGEK